MRLVFGASAIVWAMYLVLAATWQPDWMPDISLVRRLTTYEDPLDGLTRSIFASAHGDFEAAFKLNPMFLAYIGIVLYGIYASVGIFIGKIKSINPVPIFAVVGLTLTLTMIIRILAGLPIR